MSETLHFKHIRAGDGAYCSAFGDTILFKLGTEETGGQFVLGLGTTQPGGGPPLHIHGNEEEVFIVVSGTYEFSTPDGPVTANAGDVVFAPKGVPHTFKVVSDVPGTAWVMTFPSGFDKFFAKCSKEFEGGAPDMGKIMQIVAEHKLELLGAP